MRHFIKGISQNLHNQGTEFILGIDSETDTNIKTFGDFYTTFNKETKKSNGYNLIFEYLSEQEEVEYINQLKSLPMVTDYQYVNPILTLNRNISKEDLCSDGRECFYMLTSILSSYLSSLNIETQFLLKDGNSYYLVSKETNYLDIEELKIISIPNIFN